MAGRERSLVLVELKGNELLRTFKKSYATSYKAIEQNEAYTWQLARVDHNPNVKEMTETWYWKDWGIKTDKTAAEPKKKGLKPMKAKAKPAKKVTLRKATKVKAMKAKK